MVDLDVLRRKIASASAWLREIGKRLDRPREEFLADVAGRPELERFLALLAEEAGLPHQPEFDLPEETG